MKLYSMIMALMGATYSPDQVNQFLEGLAKGLTNNDDTESIQSCVKDTSAASADLAAALGEMKDELTNNLNTRGFIRGVKDLGKMISDVEP
jgi:hypothetical protein